MFRFGKKKDNTAAVAEHLKPQLQAIKAKGQEVYINEVTLAYISTLHMALSKKSSVTTGELRNTVEQIFPDEADQFWIDNAFGFITHTGADDYYQKVGALFWIAEKEIKSGSGDFYARYAEYAKNAREQNEKAGIDYDPRTSAYDPIAYIKSYNFPG